MHKSIPVVMTALGVATPTLAPAAAFAAASYKGTDYSYRYGTIEVTISVSGKRLSGLSVTYTTDSPHGTQLQSFAVPELRKEALKADSYKIHAVSGVTTTSEVFVSSLYSAMLKAHLA